MKELKAVEEKGPQAHKTEKTHKGTEEPSLDGKQTSGYINDEYLKKINEFCRQISLNAESRTGIRKFFSMHPRASEILQRQLLRGDNYAILKIHFILNMKIDKNMLLRSLKGCNVSEKNCFMIFELYFFRLFDDIETAKERFVILEDYQGLFKRAESHAKQKIVEKDWDRYEQRKYFETFVKDRRVDVTRMRRKLEQMPEILCRTKKPVDFLIVVDLDSFGHGCEQAKDNINWLELKTTRKSDISDRAYVNSTIRQKNNELEIVLDFLKENEYRYVLICRKFSPQYSYFHDFDAIKNEHVTWCVKFDYKPLLKQHAMKRCFVLKDNAGYTRVHKDCYYISFSRLYNILISLPLPDGRDVQKE